MPTANRGGNMKRTILALLMSLFMLVSQVVAHQGTKPTGSQPSKKGRSSGAQEVRRDECEGGRGHVWRQCQLTGDDRIDWGTCVNVCRGGTHDGQPIDKRLAKGSVTKPPFKILLTLVKGSTSSGQPTMRMQSFEGDVCVATGNGGGQVHHCRCEGESCQCDGGGTASCVP